VGANMDRQHFRRYDGRVRLHRPAPGAPAAPLPAPAALTSAAYEQELHAALAAGVPTAPHPCPPCLLPPPCTRAPAAAAYQPRGGAGGRDVSN
jgi:hypothetical protein